MFFELLNAAGYCSIIFMSMDNFHIICFLKFIEECFIFTVKDWKYGFYLVENWEVFPKSNFMDTLNICLKDIVFPTKRV